MGLVLVLSITASSSLSMYWFRTAAPDASRKTPATSEIKLRSTEFRYRKYPVTDENVTASDSLDLPSSASINSLRKRLFVFKLANVILPVTGVYCFIPTFVSSEYKPAIISDPPIREISLRKAIRVAVVSTPFIRCGMCIVIMKTKSRTARRMVASLTSFLVIILMLAAIRQMPVSTITKAVLGMKEVRVPI